MLDRSNDHALLRYLPAWGSSMEGQSPDQYKLIRVVYSAEYIFAVVVMFRYIDALFRNCDSNTVTHSWELRSRVIYVGCVKRGKWWWVLSTIVHGFWQTCTTTILQIQINLYFFCRDRGSGRNPVLFFCLLSRCTVIIVFFKPINTSSHNFQNASQQSSALQ